MIGDSLATAVMQRAMDGTWQRGKSVSANIANHETPGYKAVKVSFEDALKRASERAALDMSVGGLDPQGLETVKNSDIEVFQDNTFSERADASNVNLELENIEMAKFQLQYSYLARQITDTFSRLRYAIREGR
ncbi:MAG: flagellar basal body rod protein FlgB [Clostridiales Family XIII bacterium]|jgi:flagellar basal-body rod protein FlgB|nr:flagellar basal body rod protein FlgB [Clostridiales Family XIII bacterium]